MMEYFRNNKSLNMSASSSVTILSADIYSFLIQIHYKKEDCKRLNILYIRKCQNETIDEYKWHRRMNVIIIHRVKFKDKKKKMQQTNPIINHYQSNGERNMTLMIDFV